MNLIALESEHLYALKALAERVGISYNTSEITLGFNKKPEVIHKSYKGRSAYFVQEFISKKGTRELSFKFHTKRGGGKTETWNSLTGHPDFPIDKPASHQVYKADHKKVNKRSGERSEEEKRKSFEIKVTYR